MNEDVMREIAEFCKKALIQKVHHEFLALQLAYENFFLAQHAYHVWGQGDGSHFQQAEKNLETQQVLLATAENNFLAQQVPALFLKSEIQKEIEGSNQKVEYYKEQAAVLEAREDTFDLDVEVLPKIEENEQRVAYLKTLEVRVKENPSVESKFSQVDSYLNELWKKFETTKAPTLKYKKIYQQLSVFLLDSKSNQSVDIKPLNWDDLITEKEFILEVNQLSLTDAGYDVDVLAWNTKLNQSIVRHSEEIFALFEKKISAAQDLSTVHQLIAQCRFLLMDCSHYMREYREKISDIGENKAKQLLKSEIKKDASLAEKITKWTVGVGAATVTGVAVSTGHVHLSPHIMHLVNTVGHSVAVQIASMATAATAITAGVFSKFSRGPKDEKSVIKKKRLQGADLDGSPQINGIS